MPRFKPRISLRMFLVAFTALAVWLGLVVARSQRQQAALESLKSAIVIWDFQLPDGPLASWDPSIKSTGPSWLAGPSGQGLFSHVHGLIAVQEKSPEAFERLADLPDLRSLNLAGSAITDDSLAAIADLSKLQTLNLEATAVTDHGLLIVSKLPSLERLWLANTSVTDEGVQCLARLTELKALSLEGTQVTEAGMQKLKAKLPDCQISCGPTSSPQSSPVRSDVTPVR
jgi:hypothetical protein